VDETEKGNKPSRTWCTINRTNLRRTKQGNIMELVRRKWVEICNKSQQKINKMIKKKNRGRRTVFIGRKQWQSTKIKKKRGDQPPKGGDKKKAPKEIGKYIPANGVPGGDGT